MVTTKKNQHHTRNQILIFVRNVIVFKDYYVAPLYILATGKQEYLEYPLTSRAVYCIVCYFRNTHFILLSVTSFPWLVILTLELQDSFTSFLLLSQLQKSPSSVFRSYDPNKRKAADIILALGGKELLVCVLRHRFVLNLTEPPILPFHRGAARRT